MILENCGVCAEFWGLWDVVENSGELWRVLGVCGGVWAVVVAGIEEDCGWL